VIGIDVRFVELRFSPNARMRSVRNQQLRCGPGSAQSHSRVWRRCRDHRRRETSNEPNGQFSALGSAAP
jgi:hypothetical protein